MHLNHKIIFFAVLVLTAGCTKKFKEYNSDNTGITNAALQHDNNYPGLYFPNIQQQIYGNNFGDYQLTQNLSSDGYCGYMMSPIPFRGGINNLNYFMVDGWNARNYELTYSSFYSSIFLLGLKGLRTALPDFWAVALILQADAFDRLTDKFGPIPYSQIVSSTSGLPYDDQQTVYNQFFLQLDTAVSNLKTYVAAHPDLKPFAKFDMVYGGNYASWIKFANSLRLRLAMHISKVDPATAKIQGEKALADNGGLIQNNTDIARLNGFGYQNQLYTIASQWYNTSMGAAIESIMTGYNDPRITSYFTTSGIVPGKCKGIRIGSTVNSSYSAFSYPNPQAIGQYSPMFLMTPAEVWFLKAEAALRGWAGAGGAQQDYETGITTSMQQWSVAAGGYLVNDSSRAIDYVDPLNPANNIAAVSKITIKWDPAASKEEMLERIITQKWIAMYPEGGEAWTEYRRTRYPKLFPVVQNNSGGTISTQIQIRRLPYPQSEYTSNATNIQHAVQLLGGPDNGGTRLWWDTGGPNFQ